MTSSERWVWVMPHELKALREIVAYSRAIAQTFPDKSGDKFAATLTAHAQIIEDMLERIEVRPVDIPKG